MDPEEDEELPALAVQPAGPDVPRQQPLGADAYDRTAAMLAAARKGPDALAQYLEEQQGYQFDSGYNGAQGAVPLRAETPGTLGNPEPGAPPVGVPGAAPAQSDYQAQLAALMARIERNQQMQEQGVEAAFERSKPSESEKWLGIAAALASPTQYGSFGETMGNVFNALIQHKQGVRKAEGTRQSELARLRQAYDIAGINAAARGLKPPTAQSVWSESLGRFVPKDRVVAVGSGVTADGKPITKYSDGTMGVRDADGSMVIYDADGSKIGVRARGEAQ